MKILYVTQDDSSNPHSENNAYYLRDELENFGHNIVPVTTGTPDLFEKAVFGPVKMAYRLFSRDYRVAVEPVIVKRRVERLKERIEQEQPDVVFANSPIVVSGLECATPYVIYTDAPITSLLGMGHYYSNWPKRSQLAFVRHDQLAVRGASKVIYHSRWAADAARMDYSLESNKVAVVLPGANLQPVDPALANLEKPKGPTCNLLFWGRDWERKGGPLAVRVVAELNNLGIEAKLTIGGPSEIPTEVKELEFVTFLGRVAKKTLEGNGTIARLFGPIDYMLLPTRADASTSAIREASAFGIPSLVTDVGGLAELVEHRQSGYVLNLDAQPDDYVKAIAANFSDERDRKAMRHCARAKYVEHLNWTVAVSKIERIINEVA